MLGETGIAGPLWIVARVTLDDLPGLEVNLRMEFNDPRYVVSEVSVIQYGSEIKEVTSDLLRSIPVQSLARQFLAGVLLRASDGRTRTKPPKSLSIPIGHPIGQDDKEYRRIVGRDFPSLSSEQQVAVVARMYRIAVVVNDAPTKLIQETLGVSRSTASRHVARAREVGALGRDEVGRGRSGAPSRKSL